MIQKPRKIYCIDNGLRNAISLKFSEDQGKLAENLVFLELKRQGREIFYYSDKKECDFVIKHATANIKEAIQVCYELTRENREREIEGLKEAMNKFGLKEGLILTHYQEEEIKLKNKKIFVKPVWKWILE